MGIRVNNTNNARENYYLTRVSSEFRGVCLEAIIDDTEIVDRTVVGGLRAIVQDEVTRLGANIVGRRRLLDYRAIVQSSDPYSCVVLGHWVSTWRTGSISFETIGITLVLMVDTVYVLGIVQRKKAFYLVRVGRYCK